MVDRSSTGRKTAIAPAARPRAAAARPRSAARRSRKRRRAVVVACAIFLVAAVGVMVMEAAPRAISLTTVEPAPVASAAPDGDLRAAKITVLGENGCSQQVFDNQTGRLVGSQRPCETSAHDSAETTHRLDALSKSFSGR